MSDDDAAAGVGPYLRRIGLSPAVDPAAGDDPAAAVDAASDREALAELQAAHLRSVPFETLSITGPPDSDATGPGVSLELGHLYGKIVERGRGGFCFELNGLFAWLLSALGFETDRVAGMVLPDEGAPTPANHHATVVALDRRYVVDVGTGVPAPWRPVPLDGTPVTDERGTGWRVVASTRPDSEHRLEYRTGNGWATRYVFDDEPRALSYFRASCSYLASAPESVFTGDPVVIRRTADGHRKLTADTLTEVSDGRETGRSVAPGEWRSVLRERFDLTVPDW